MLGGGKGSRPRLEQMRGPNEPSISWSPTRARPCRWSLTAGCRASAGGRWCVLLTERTQVKGAVLVATTCWPAGFTDGGSAALVRHLLSACARRVPTRAVRSEDREGLPLLVVRCGEFVAKGEAAFWPLTEKTRMRRSLFSLPVRAQSGLRTYRLQSRLHVSPIREPPDSLQNGFAAEPGSEPQAGPRTQMSRVYAHFASTELSSRSVESIATRAESHSSPSIPIVSS